MRKLYWMIGICLILFTGCSNNPSVNMQRRNSGDTQVNKDTEDQEASMDIEVSGAGNISGEDGTVSAEDEIPFIDNGILFQDEAEFYDWSSLYSETEDLSTNHITISDLDKAGDVIEIREKLFIAQTNDIYYNFEDYLGKIIKYEGIFDVYEFPDTGELYYSVIRYGPGCCGVDANAGFEVVWDEEYPNHGDWVEAAGKLEEYDENGIKYLRLSLSSLTVKTERGKEYVVQ